MFKKTYAYIRNNPREAERILNVLFPDISTRDMAIKILVDAVKIASRIAPASWGISLFLKRLCLNVGRGAVLQFYPGQILFIVTGQVLNKTANKERSSFQINGYYKFVPDSIEGWLLHTEISKYPVFQIAHIDLIERAAQSRKICLWPKAHSPSVIEYLRSCGHDVPSPQYADVADIDETDPKIAIDLNEMERITTEGRRVLRSHILRERNHTLVRRKKLSVLQATQCLSCEVCGFDFEKRYGSIGFAFAEVHHIEPLGSASMPRTIRLSDLAIVCSNCHRMLHRGNPVFSLDNLRARIQTI